MNDTFSNPSEGAGRPAERHVFGWLLFPLALFPLVALMTYDWRAIAALMIPPEPSTNWIGPLGDGFAYWGYRIFGLAIWIVPVMCLVGGLCLVAGRRMRPGRRGAWFTLFLVCAACLMQVAQGHAPGIQAFLGRINLANAGGAFGYLIMTRFLSRFLSDFGASVIVVILLLISLVAAIGLHNLLSFFVAIYRWVTIGKYLDRVRAAREAGASDSPADAADAEQDMYLAALAAKDEAKRQREADKARARAEKEAAREEARAAREAEREAARAAREAARAEREAARNDAVRTPAPARTAATATDGAEADAEKPADKGPYILPSVGLLSPLKKSQADHSDVGATSQKLIDTLKLFDVNAELAYTVQGPVVTKYALTPEPGTRPEKFTSLQATIMMALKAKSLRIEAPIPGEDKIGIEVPNLKPAGISFREIFESDAWRNAKAELPLLFGKRADGRELVADLATMPHMLVAGATGQGKSVCLNSLICGLLMTRTPEQLKLIMVDPKCVEFTPYSKIPHLLVPVITDNRKVVFSLHWAVAEMEKRLKLFARARVRNIYDFNHRKTVTQTDMFGNDEPVNADMPKTVPYIVIIIDEAADLIGQCGKEVNPDIQRITQKARAAGIHLILATQRPDAKIITGTIKANIPGRVAFKTSQAIDSRTILDEAGAENLIGRGDMLFRGKDGLLIRAQGAWISDEEIANITSFIEEHANTQFDEKFATKLGRVKEAAIEDPFASNEDDPDNQPQADAQPKEVQRAMVKAAADADDFKKAVECVINTKRASTSHFQRQMGWGYNHAAKILDMLTERGIVSAPQGMGPRQIIMDQDQLVAILNGGDGDGAAANDEPVDNADTPENNEEAAQ